jgi:hypothetical protein
MSNIVVKEKKVKKEKKLKIPPIVSVDEIEDMCPPKIPKKVSLQKSQPLVVVEEKKEEIIDIFIPAVESPPDVFDDVFSVNVPVVIDKMEIFKEMRKILSKQKRDAKTAGMTPEQLVEKKRIACEKNKTFRTNNKDNIKAKDKKYSTENAELIKAKRDEKLKDPVEREKVNLKQRESKAKKRAEIKTTAEPKPKKEKKQTKAQKKVAIMNNPDLTTEQKLELVLALV